MAKNFIWPDSAVFMMALIAGAFALTNARNKRVGSFKAPKEIAQTCPENLNPTRCFKQQSCASYA